MVTNEPGSPPRSLWAYAYQIVPAQPHDHMRAITVLLDREHGDAHREQRIWGGRIIFEPGITEILVVSDSPDQDRDVNRRLEAELKNMKASFLITHPLVVVDQDPTDEAAL